MAGPIQSLTIRVKGGDMWIQINEVLNRAMVRVTTAVADFLPGLLALLIILFFAIVVAFVLRVAIRRSLERAQFDRRIDQWGLSGLAEWSPAHSPTLLMARAGFWMVVLIGLLIGVSALDARLTSVLVVRLFTYLPNVLAAAVVLIVGVVLSRFLARSILISAVNMQIQSARLLSLGVKWLVVVLTFAMALEQLGIGGRIVQLSFAILFGGIVLTLALAVGLGSKEMVSRSWERQTDKLERESEEHFHHL
jgi:hypothetical protein